MSWISELPRLIRAPNSIFNPEIDIILTIHLPEKLLNICGQKIDIDVNFTWKSSMLINRFTSCSSVKGGCSFNQFSTAIRR
jgi:hypothetical protein